MFPQRRKIFYLFLTFVASFAWVSYENPFEDLELRQFKNNSCGRYPADKDIIIDNSVWQVLTLPNVICSLFNAYLDDRDHATIVRVSMMSKELNIATDTIFCQFWFRDDSNQVPVVVKATKYVKIWDRDTPGFSFPYLVTCPVESKTKIPVAVSLTTEACADAKNKLTIINNQPVNGVKEKFGVCNKFIFYEDRKDVIKFIEWMSILRILGASKVRLFKKKVHSEFLEIMEHYVEKGYLEYYNIQDPSGFKPMDELLLNRFAGKDAYIQVEMFETLMHTDCFYKSRNLYEFVIVIDCDEVIIPTDPGDYTWHDLVKKFDFTKGYNAFLSNNLIIPNLGLPPHSDIPEYHYMLQHTMRVKKTNNWVKQIYIPDRVVSVYIHTLMFCLNPSSDTHFCKQQNALPEEWSLVYHFRDSYNPQSQKSNDTISDTTMWKYKNDLIREVNQTLLETNFKP